VATSTVVHLNEIEEGTDGTMRWRPVRHHLGILGFGVSAWTGRAAGDRVIKEHEEPHEELYLVHEGRASFEVDGDRLDAPAGTLVFVRPGVTRTAFADEPGTTIIAMGGMPGQAFEPDGWEIWSPLRPLYVAGDYESVVERGRAVIEAHPEYAEPMFNLACCESLLGRTDDSLDHLRRAIASSERMRALAREDSELDPIRDEPAFRELVSG
jgi:mannose-6-phosphate isomerase-like protein (cupin superfamily)